MDYKWLIKEAKKTEDDKDVVILEKPDIKKELDDMLIKKYWPVIERSLKDTGYIYSPNGKPKTEFEFSHELTRSLTFMLFDYECAIFIKIYPLSIRYTSRAAAVLAGWYIVMKQYIEK